MIGCPFVWTLQLYLLGEPRGRVRLRLVEQRSVQVVKAGRGVSDALDPVEGVAQGRPAAHAREQMGDGNVRAVADGIGRQRQALGQGDVEVARVATGRVAAVHDNLAERQLQCFTFRSDLPRGWLANFKIGS